MRAVAFCIALCLSAACAAMPTPGRNGTLERNIKAAFLYKFLGYVEWPPASFSQPDSPFVIGVVGADDVADELSRITVGRNVNRRGVKLRRLKSGDPLTGIHLLFIGQSESSQEALLLKSTQKQPILTVTESEDALAYGSMINFRLVGGRVRFDVSLAAVEKSDLKLSSRLLSVAASVQGTAR